MRQCDAQAGAGWAKAGLGQNRKKEGKPAQQERKERERREREKKEVQFLEVWTFCPI